MLVRAVTGKTSYFLVLLFPGAGCVPIPWADTVSSLGPCFPSVQRWGCPCRSGRTWMLILEVVERAANSVYAFLRAFIQSTDIY